MEIADASENGSGMTQTTTATESDPSETTANNPAAEKWPGWPGHCVFRLIVPVTKVGSIIGRKGELIKKMCEETRARIRVLDGAVGTPDRIVLISGKEEPEAPLSPAMDAAIRVFKRVSGFPDNDTDAKAVGATFCSIRLLVASTQAISLIGKQGSLIKSLQESTGASVRVLSGEETASYVAADERIAELQGEALKVLKALEAVVSHLRKFLVDQTVLPLFEKTHNSVGTQDLQAESRPEKLSLLTASQSGIGIDLPIRRESLFLEHEKQFESRIPSSGISFFGQDPALSMVHSSSGLHRSAVPIVTQIAQTMQIPFSYAEDIIGIGGVNIAYIRRTSGAVITVQESGGLSDEITVEIKGTSIQVQLAQQLIQEFMSNHKDPITSSSGYRDTGYRSSFSQLGNTSSLSSQQPYGGYGGPSSVSGYSTFRL
ncbi:RNA-binding KH domain-containing protein PEPPER [Hibiscus syriacus]|uniref:RNA-binding KH domain-containing protein PEPPER n=1 Tax=Hibiscus syriacus TaxID=106335 RepID=A0A6A3BXT6_HIBSY|nr:RNA-binding KH domain-containing protein PEPPER-like isoform X1 [Hibiscus syriacus]XP_039064201.1 RNA-binding KH domain-containing protein PEPPER-like isoform X1 [Hibiscus syriacus]KAE8720757.1 RNA-binding KH domain-containing protein PEPPER [Hibiscus syriacus]